MSDLLDHPVRTLVAAIDSAALDNLHERTSIAHPGVVIRRLRGGKCADERAFFDEAMAALQFPQYQGTNWNAFEESLSQYWLPAEGMLILVADAQRIFADSSDALAVLSRIVEGGLVPPPRPLRLLYQTPPAEHEAFVARLARAGVAHATI
jgi:hypothetical protein